MDAVRVAAAVMARGDRVLLCQRRASDRHPGKWEFPGGKFEDGETAAACARRELREELGIEAVAGGELWRTRHAYADLAVELVFVRIESFAPEPRNLCFADVRWVALSELESYDVLDGDRELISRLVAHQIPL